MNRERRIGMMVLVALLLFGSVGNVFAEGDGTPKNESGNLYAGAGKNYVSEDVLTVGFQATSKTDGDEPATAALRIVTTVNALFYKKVGFQIRISDQDGSNLRKKEVSTNKVYKKLTVTEGSNSPDYNKTPKAFCEESKYFATYTITNIPKMVFRNTYFTVTPYWITEDDVTVYGITRSVMLGDAYDGIVSVPVRLNSNIDTAAGSVEVTYPADTLNYAGYFNSGDIYEEMEVNGETSGTVKCVGNVENISNNKKADGMYVSLRFKIIQSADAGALPEAEVGVRTYMFCDNKKEIVEVPVVQAKYYTFNELNTLRLLTFNVRVDVLKDDNGLLTPASKNRIQAVEEQILSYEPDLIGLQEDGNVWKEHLTIDRKNYTRYIPNGSWDRDSIEYCSIYVKNGIHVKASGWQWMNSGGTEYKPAMTYAKLSEMDPDVARELGITKDEDLRMIYTDASTNTNYGVILSPKLMNWVLVERDGKDVIYVNTHFQHRGDAGKKNYDDHPLFKLRYYERQAQFQVLQEKISELRTQYPDADVMLAGDFNDIYGSGFYQEVAESYTDSKYVAKNDAGKEYTLNAAYVHETQGQGYDSGEENTVSLRLDYCFISEKLEVDTYQVGACYWILKQAVATQEKNLKVYPSDHLPVIVDLHLTKKSR